MHWLVGACVRAGIRTVEGFSPRATATIPEAWEAVARVAGCTPGELAIQIASALHVRPADVDAGDRRALRLVPERVSRQHGVFPLREDNRTIVVASSNPVDIGAEQALEFASGRRVTFELASPDAIARALNAGYSPNLVLDTVLGARGVDADELVRVIEDDEPEVVSAVDVEAEPIVRLTSVILRDAITQEASDIHIEPGTGGGTVRFRIDGMLRVHLHLPMTIVIRVVSRIKVLSRLDISQRHRPQDGRARIHVDGRDFDLRVSTVPTRDAEKAVIRILRPMTERTLDNVGIAPQEVARLRQLLGHRDGLVAITGPTGSGKTTTIYAAIREIAAREVNLVTVEDPVEYNIAGITQIQTDAKRNVTFASALRSILRQDPDVIFVGEIRDLETAEMAVQAAMTGHLVLATVHANDAVGAVARLRDLGLDTASIGATFRGAIAQRLVRRLCPHCVVEVTGSLTPDEERLASAFGVRPLRRPVGCDSCANTGYRGRLPVAEVAMTNAAMAGLVISGGTIERIQREAIAGGMRPLRQSGLARVVTGETTLQEVERVLGGAIDTGGDPLVDVGVDEAAAGEDDLPIVLDPVDVYEVAPPPEPVTPQPRAARSRAPKPAPPPPEPSLPPVPEPLPEPVLDQEPEPELEAEPLWEPEPELEAELEPLLESEPESSWDPDPLFTATPTQPPPRRQVPAYRTPAQSNAIIRPRVLIVSNDAGERAEARRTLEGAGFEIVEASGGPDAVETLKRDKRFALIVADLSMREIDGAGLVRIVRGYLARDIPILILTGALDIATEATLLRDGADDYLRKPLEAPWFIARVTATIRRTSV